MKLIAHRGNTEGTNPELENHPSQIDKCIKEGYDVEVDLRIDHTTNTVWLGHDEPQHMVTWWWLAGRAKNLWIHCKTLDTLHYMSKETSGYNFFWHQEDDYTLTSKNFIWAYPGKPYTSNTIMVMPEWKNVSWDTLRVTNCYGICSDYVKKLK